MKTHSHRIELRDRLVSLHRALPGSKLSYEEVETHHVWKSLVLRNKHGIMIACVCTTGKFLNHWFVDCEQDRSSYAK